jgi:DNA-binding transcriptional ArsR family regulator
MSLYVLGLNVFPVPYGKKGGYPWGMMQYSRLNAEDIYPLFQGNCNIAVMTGRTSGNLFVIDCETKLVFDHHKKLLREAGIPIYSVQSRGRRDGGHLYLRCSDGQVKNIPPGERKDVEIRGNRCYVLCPPSLHPDTRRTYEWDERETPEPPQVTAQQIHWLGLTITKDRPTPPAPQPFSELSAATREFILNGATDGERNNRLFIAACDLSGNDYTEYEAQRLLVPVAQKSGLGVREIHDTIQSAFSKPRTPAKIAAQKDNRPAAWQLAQQWVEEQTWKGRTGQTDRAVFLACCERAKTANETGIFRAATREIAELARIRPNTASTALKRLEEAKILIFCGKDRDSQSHLYRLSVSTQKLRYRYTTTLSSGGVSVSVTQTFSSLFPDAAERGALYKTPYLVYSFLRAQEQPIKPAVIRQGVKLSASQVSRALKRLQEYSLVLKTDGRYTAVAMTNADLDERVARPAGTFGKGEDRRKRHEKERASRAARRLYKARFGRERSVSLTKPLATFVCSNCGQIWHIPGIEPPLQCEFCGDATTWKRL